MLVALLATLLPLSSAFAGERESIKLTTAKQDNIRSYSTSFSQEIKAPLESVRANIVNFADKCDQRFAHKRQWESSEKSCKHHWPNLVEVKVQNELLDAPKSPGEVQRYILQKRVYDRVSYQYQELVREFQHGDQYVIEISMLDDKSAPHWLSSPLSTDYPFQDRRAVYTLMKTTTGHTHVSYQLTSKTSHWLLSREILVPQTLESMVQETLGIKRSLDPKERSVASIQK